MNHSTIKQTGKTFTAMYRIMTASGYATKTREFDTQDEAEAFCRDLNSQPALDDGFWRYEAQS